MHKASIFFENKLTPTFKYKDQGLEKQIRSIEFVII